MLDFVIRGLVLGYAFCLEMCVYDGFMLIPVFCRGAAVIFWESTVPISPGYAPLVQGCEEF